MIWVTHLNPVPGEEELSQENFTDWQYAVDPSGALILTKDKEKTIFGPGFWVRLDDDEVSTPKAKPAKVHRIR